MYIFFAVLNKNIKGVLLVLENIIHLQGG
jgi:hypothetical protein